MILFGKKDYNAELESLKKAQEILDKNYEKKVINQEYYIKKCQEFTAKREKIEKRLNQ
ncbi:MAG: hypothetical protein ACI4OT_05960 [Bacilli bacterium]